MSRNGDPVPRGQGKQHSGGRKRSFGLSYDEIRTIDRELDRLFNEYWEGSERSKAVLAQQRRKKQLADAERRDLIDQMVFGDDSGLDEPPHLT